MNLGRRWFQNFLLALLGAAFCGCSTHIPSLLLPPPLPVAREQQKVAATLFPLPVVGTDPNSGNDYGVLPVWVFPRADKAIGMILAPSIIDNDFAGTSLAFRLLAYPAQNVHYRLIADPSTKIRSFYEAAYEKSAEEAGEWFYLAQFVYDCDIFPRFYGFGNNSLSSNQTSYTFRSRTLFGSLGYRFAQSWEIAWYERFNVTSLSDNHLANLRSTVSVFPAVMQNRRDTASIHGISCSYDTRDYKETPTCGVLARLYAETSLAVLGSDSSFDKVGFEVRGFQPWDLQTRRSITAVQLQADFMTRELRTPFYRWPSLGGYRTNRGWGEWRWLDRNMVSFSLEQRFTVFQFHRFGVTTNFEVAPFVDVGKVFPTFRRFHFREVHAAAGLALRAVVRPQVVGHVEVGIGEGGNNAVFMGLGYPF
ncbi:MAG: BamA/TamA family outer membrane protein [Desulfobacca sp.]|uniref:BamA/TamA family outer membrane protein n=1 Tax=Desulfobacca sp. TaxID=2067990 RepID=UPI00404B7B92